MKRKRVIQIGDQIRDCLATSIRESVRDPRIGFVTITSVDVSTDLRYAKVFVSSIGAERGETLEALTSAAPFLQHEIAENTRLRYVPKLTFLWDDSTEQGFQIESILDRELNSGGQASQSGGETDSESSDEPSNEERD